MKNLNEKSNGPIVAYINAIMTFSYLGLYHSVSNPPSDHNKHSV